MNELWMSRPKKRTIQSSTASLSWPGSTDWSVSVRHEDVIRIIRTATSIWRGYRRRANVRLDSLHIMAETLVTLPWIKWGPAKMCGCQIPCNLTLQSSWVTNQLMVHSKSTVLVSFHQPVLIESIYIVLTDFPIEYGSIMLCNAHCYIVHNQIVLDDIIGTQIDVFKIS